MDKSQNRWRRPKGAKLVGLITLGLSAAIFFGFLYGFFVRILWNWLMPDLFNLKEITYWQAFGIVMLARLVFGSRGGSRSGGSRSSRTSKRERLSSTDGYIQDSRHWRYYDEWWQGEGKQAFAEYVEKQVAAKVPPDASTVQEEDRSDESSCL